MTDDQIESRAERVAIMVVEGMSEDAAHAYCDSVPSMYGLRDVMATQSDLFGSSVFTGVVR